MHNSTKKDNAPKVVKAKCKSLRKDGGTTSTSKAPPKPSIGGGQSIAGELRNPKHG